jgi:hypothetical protein
MIVAALAERGRRIATQFAASATRAPAVSDRGYNAWATKPFPRFMEPAAG